MKTTKILMLTLASAAILTSCTNTYHVTSKNTFDKTVNDVKSELAKQGYVPSGNSTDTKNNVYVAGTSYSKYSGYGSKMANDFITTDTYRFTSDDGNTMSFSVSYKTEQDNTQNLIYVTSITTAGCETSNAKQYESLCGTNSPIKKIDSVPQDATIEKPDVVGNTFLVTGLGVLAALLILIL